MCLKESWVFRKLQQSQSQCSPANVSHSSHSYRARHHLMDFMAEVYPKRPHRLHFPPCTMTQTLTQPTSYVGLLEHIKVPLVMLKVVLTTSPKTRGSAPGTALVRHWYAQAVDTVARPVVLRIMTRLAGFTRGAHSWETTLTATVRRCAGDNITGPLVLRCWNCESTQSHVAQVGGA